MCVALSFVRQGNLNLDEYQEDVLRNNCYAVERVDGHYCSLFPIGAPLLAVPFVQLLNEALPSLLAAFPRLRQSLQVSSPRPYDTATIGRVITANHGRFEKLVASFLVGLTAALLYPIARRSLSMPLALLTCGILAFCTSAWSTASRALWQHGPSMLMLTTALYLLLFVYVVSKCETPSRLHFGLR